MTTSTPVDRLSALPDEILTHILSLLGVDTVAGELSLPMLILGRANMVTTVVTHVLLSAQAVDSTTRSHAEESLKQLQDQNPPCTFLLSLSAELADDEKPVESRQLAGLILKNALITSWLSLDRSVKRQIKSSLLQTLSSASPDARSTASQVIAKVGGIDPTNIIDSLLSKIHRASPHRKQATLRTLGYLCEEVESDGAIDQGRVSKILTVVVQGMDIANEGSAQVRLAATRALCSALRFARAYFSNDKERAYLMRVVFESTLSPEVEIRQAAFECLVSIGSANYEKLVPYIGEISNITWKTVITDKEHVALQAMEFWLSVCDKELDIVEGFSVGCSDVPCCNLIKQALPDLVPLLKETLLVNKEDDDQEEGAWNLAMAGGTCLGLVARLVGDDILPLFMPFIECNIMVPDWRAKEAATHALGSISEGPSHHKLLPVIESVLNSMLITLTKDVSSRLKSTTAWTLGRIFGVLHESSKRFPSTIITSAHSKQILPFILQNVNDAPYMAEKACGSLCYLAQHYGLTSLLTPYFQEIVESLLYITQTEDAGDSRLKKAAYKTLNEVVRSCSDETCHLVLELLQVIITDLHNMLGADIYSFDDRVKHNSHLLFELLHGVIRRLGASEPTKHAFLTHYADQIMNLFQRGLASEIATFRKEAMLTIGVFAKMMGADFTEYMPEVYTYLEKGLQNFERYEVCAATVGVVGDICSALGDKFLPYCDGIMTLLLINLWRNEFHRLVDPQIFFCFGAIARALREKFEKFFAPTMAVLQCSAEFCARKSPDNDKMTKFINLLKDGILEAYSEIFNCFNGEFPKSLFPYVNHIPGFLDSMQLDVMDLKRYNIESVVSKAAKDELELTKEILSRDPRNYQAWSRRQGIIPSMDRRLWLSEIQYCHDIIDKDIFNVSAWDQICRTIKLNKNHLDKELRDRESDYVRKAIYSQPRNEGPWLYLKCLYVSDKKRLYRDPVLESLYVDLLANEAYKLKYVDLDPPNQYRMNYATVDTRVCVQALNLIVDLMLIGYEAEKNERLVWAVKTLYSNMISSPSYVDLSTVKTGSTFDKTVCALVVSLEAFRVRYCYMYRGSSDFLRTPIADDEEDLHKPCGEMLLLDEYDDLSLQTARELFESFLTSNGFVSLRLEWKENLFQIYLQKRRYNRVESDVLDDLKWYVRQLVIQHDGSNVDAALDEIQFTTDIIKADGYNHRAWSHRQWVFDTFGQDWNDVAEFEFCAKIIEQNPFNSFAWDQRHFLIKRWVTRIHKANGRDECDRIKKCFVKMLDKEVDFASRNILANPENQLAWGQIGGIYMAYPRWLYLFCNNECIKSTILRVLEMRDCSTGGLSSMNNARGTMNALNMFLDIYSEHGVCSVADNPAFEKALDDIFRGSLCYYGFENEEELPCASKVVVIIRSLELAVTGCDRLWQNATDEFLKMYGIKNGGFRK